MIWGAIRGAIAFVFGDEIFKWVAYAVLGLGVFITLEAFGTASAIFGQPWGQWWAAGQFGPSLVHSGSGASFVGGGTAITINPSAGGLTSIFERYQLATSAGFQGQNAIIAVAVSLAEDDNGDPARQHRNDDGSIDTCLWQINSRNAAEFGGIEALKTPTICAHAAFVIFSRAHGFCPWFTYDTACDPPGVHLHTGAYASHLADAALAAVQSSDNPWFTDAYNYATTWINVPYFFGGCSRNGIDCSCFVENVLAHVGINAPRTTVQQIAWAHRISADQAIAGDLVFFDNTCTDCGANPTHEGLYIGGGKMIDAGGKNVHIQNVSDYAANNPRFARVP